MHGTQLFGEVLERGGEGCKYQDVCRPTAEEWGVGWACTAAPPRCLGGVKITEPTAPSAHPQTCIISLGHNTHRLLSLSVK